MHSSQNLVGVQIKCCIRKVGIYAFHLLLSLTILCRFLIAAAKCYDCPD